jgi:GntR family transcriptional regulator
MLSITLNNKSPIYEQLVERIEFLILNGFLKENEQLPSVRELATHLAINPNTVQKAYAYLEQEGVTYSVSGKGRFVTDNIEALKQKRMGHILNDFINSVKLLKKSGADINVLKDEIGKIYEEEK